MVKLLDLKIDVARLLPDVILVDLEPPGRNGKLLIIFVEVVFTAGPLDANRKAQMLEMMARSKHGYTSADAASLRSTRTGVQRLRAAPLVNSRGAHSPGLCQNRTTSCSFTRSVPAPSQH